MPVINPYPIRPDDAEVSARLDDWWQDCGALALRLCWEDVIKPGTSASAKMKELVEVAFRAGYIRGLNGRP